MKLKIMLDRRHVSLAWMIMILFVCNSIQLAGSSGIFQVRVLSFLSFDSNINLSNPDRHWNSSHEMVNESLEREDVNCSIRIEICLSHHLLPIPRNLQCTLGHVFQYPWLQDQNIEIPFTFKWPGALAASVKVIHPCKSDTIQSNRTIAHLIFAHDVLPSKIWTSISQVAISSSGARDRSDFRLPARQPELDRQTNLVDSLKGQDVLGMRLKMGGKTPNTVDVKSEANKLNGQDVFESKLGLNIHDSQSRKTKVGMGNKGIGEMVISGAQSVKQSQYLNTDDFQMSHNRESFVELLQDHLYSTEISSNLTSSNDGTNFTYVEEDEDIISDIIPSKQTSVSYKSGRVSVIFRVVCKEHYFGNGCSEFCRPKDDLIGHFRCSMKGEKQCLDGWSGLRCTTAVCRQSCPVERGTCTRPDECTCKPGWYGHECEQCRTARGCRHGRCENRPGQCVCHKGWTGPLCDVESQYCVDNQPCHNNGKCVHDQSHNYTCLCKSGYTGTNCQVPVCHQHFCLHGGTCLTSEGTRYCLCPAPFKGPRCQHFDLIKEKTTKHEVSIHENLLTSNSKQSESCADVIHCLNGGQCVQSLRGDGYICRCQEPFEGEFCEIDTRDPCQEYICLNRGKCKINDGEPYCVCKLGFSGDFCEQKSTKCSRQYCENGGTCIEHKRKYKCMCRKNFYGLRCENKAKKRDEKKIKVNVWSVRMTSTKKESSANLRAHSPSVFLILVIILYKSFKNFITDL